MKINPYLGFDGRCREAFEFYKSVLGGEINMMMTHGESPMADQTPAEWKDKIMHVSMSVGDQVLMGGDAPPQYYSKPQGMSVSIAPNDVTSGKRIFDAFAEGGDVRMPFEKTFWSSGFGMVIDRFGTPWMINCQ